MVIRPLATILALCCITCTCTSLVQFTAAQTYSNSGDNGPTPFYRGPGVMPSQILRSCGYRVEDHYIRSEDGYQILITRALNPLINNGTRGANNRIPILFVHGILESFNVFVINSFNVQPRDYTQHSLTSMSLAEAQMMFGGEPSARNLPTFAMNLGHEVWILSRRGYPGSQDLKGNPVKGASGEQGGVRVEGPVTGFAGGITNYGLFAEQVAFSANAQFWKYSMDEQMGLDLPAAVDYILEVTGRHQLSIVGHSAGGTIALMSLSALPAMNQKINSAIFWAQGFNLGHGGPFARLTFVKPALEFYSGPFPPVFTADQVQALFIPFCTIRATQSTLCEFFGDLILGDSGGQAPLSAELLTSLLYGSPSHELAQLFQCVEMNKTTHYYDYGRAANLAKYGQATPPVYDLSRVTLDKLSFYMGETDGVVTVADGDATLEQIRVPYRRHLIAAPFNHQGYFYSENNSRLAIIPSLREIQQFFEQT